MPAKLRGYHQKIIKLMLQNAWFSYGLNYFLAEARRAFVILAIASIGLVGVRSWLLPWWLQWACEWFDWHPWFSLSPWYLRLGWLCSVDWVALNYNVSSVVEFLRWWVLKCKIFAQESTSSKDFFLKQSCNEIWFVKKCQNCTFKVNFLCQKWTEFFQKKRFI